MSTKLQDRDQTSQIRALQKKALDALSQKHTRVLEKTVYDSIEEDARITERADRVLKNEEEEVDVEGLNHKLNACQWAVYLIGFSYCLTRWSRDTIKAHQSNVVALKARASMDEMLHSVAKKQAEIGRCVQLMKISKEFYQKAERRGREDEKQRRLSEYATQYNIKILHEAELAVMNEKIAYYRDQFIAMDRISANAILDNDKRETVKSLGPHLNPRVSDVVRSRREGITFKNSIKRELERDQDSPYEIPPIEINNDILKSIESTDGNGILVDSDDENEETTELDP